MSVEADNQSFYVLALICAAVHFCVLWLLCI